MMNDSSFIFEPNVAGRWASALCGRVSLSRVSLEGMEFSLVGHVPCCQLKGVFFPKFS